MFHFFRSLTRPVTSTLFDVRAGQTVSWLAALLVLVFGLLKLGRLPLSETELFFGVLLVLTVSLLGVLIGLVLPMSGGPSQRL